jgi:hypothetical protein
MRQARALAPGFLALLLTLAGPLASAADAPGGSDVYTRMQRLNADLRSYQADLHVDVTTHTFPYLSPSLDGKAYYQQPDKNAIVFETVPALAGQFRKIYPQLEPPSEWPRLYDVTPVADDGTTSRFRLVRKKIGRIDHVDVTADDKTATVTSMTYYYKDSGGVVAAQQNYDRMGSDYVIRSQSLKVDIPHYSADVATTFSNYKLNVKIDEAVFSTE